MKTFQAFVIGLSVLATATVAAGQADAQGGTLDFNRNHGTLQFPKAAPVPPYKPYNGAAPYDGAPTPHRAPHQIETPGSYHRPIRDEDSDRGTLARQKNGGPYGYHRPIGDEDSDRGTLKRQGGAFGR